MPNLTFIILLVICDKLHNNKEVIAGCLAHDVPSKISGQFPYNETILIEHHIIILIW